MGARLRGIAVLVVVLVGGAFLGSALGQWWSSGEAAAPGLGGAGSTPERVRVEVLNGGGESGMAHAATDHLREKGFDVVYYGNADSFGRDSSVVLDRVGRLDVARAVADAMGIRSVRSEPDANLYLDVTVVLGKEWGPPLGEMTGEEPLPAWWDLRRYFEHARPREDSGSGRMANPGEDGGS